jgi:uncharacterized membrane protein
MNNDTHGRAADHPALERLLFFSDAVFAIAITLLVIEIRVPALPHGAGDAELGASLVGLIPRVVGFVTSFFLIGQTWVEHHRIGRQLLGYDRGLLWKNLGFLFFVASMPFSSALLSEYFTTRIAVTIYALTFTGLGFAKAALWRHAARRRLVDPGTPESVSIGRRVWATPIAAVCVAIAGASGVPYAVAGFGLIPVVAQLLDRPRKTAHIGRDAG